MGLKLEKCLELFCQNIFLFLCFFALLLYFRHSMNIYSPLVCESKWRKIAQFG
jgi:hypothetical protein